MSEQHDVKRRLLLSAFAGLSFSAITSTPTAARISNIQGRSRTLVVYFSRSGNTRVIAGVIHRQLNTDLFEIEPAIEYPEDYFQTVELAKQQRDRGIKPPLKNRIENIDNYQTVYLGFPIWGTTVPPPVQRFLSSYDLNHVHLVPFITHGGYGIGDSEAILASLAATAKRDAPLVIECNQERKTTEAVLGWLAKKNHNG